MAGAKNWLKYTYKIFIPFTKLQVIPTRAMKEILSYNQNEIKGKLANCAATTKRKNTIKK